MPQGNPLGYLPPETQALLLGVAGRAPIGFHADGYRSAMPSAAPARAAPFEPSDLDLLDVRQRMRTPQWLADKYEVPLETVMAAYPEFIEPPKQQPKQQPDQPGQPGGWRQYNPFDIAGEALER